MSAAQSRSSERASAAGVSVRGLEKAYSLDAGRRVAALSGIDLDVQSGEIVTIVGAKQTTSRPELVMASIALFALLGKLTDRGLEWLGRRCSSPAPPRTS